MCGFCFHRKSEKFHDAFCIFFQQLICQSELVKACNLLEHNLRQLVKNIPAVHQTTFMQNVLDRQGTVVSPKLKSKVEPFEKALFN